MKKILLSKLIIGVMCVGVTAYAESDVVIPQTPVLSTVTTVSEREEKVSSDRIQKIRFRANQLIKERVNALTSNSKVIAADKSLTSEQKATLTAVLNKNIAGLTALQASIASSTDATTTKNLVNSIFTDFRIYGVVIPQVRLEKRIYDLQNHAGKLSSAFLKVQTRIDDQRAKGKDVTEWQKNLDDAKLLVANDMYTLTNLFKKVSALQPSDYGTTSKAVIEQTNADLKAVMKDFSTIRKNLNTSSDKVARQKNEKGKRENKKDSDLTSTSWTWVSSTQNGITTSAPAGGKFVLTFGKEKRVSSTTDCNGVGGEYEVGQNSSLTFGKFMSTMMFCEGSSEQAYTSELMKTTSYTMSSTSLSLVNSVGTMLFVRK